MEKTLIYQQDDAMRSCDSLDLFDEKMKEVTGMTRREFIDDADETERSEMESKYFIGGFMISIAADDPFWRLYRVYY